ncbi:MAG: tripartite tricarboxylate transporter TctB family protein [Clostridium sp.]|nr:tripartite tricarboxylate transporter TctB family protein [Clostridium sp.]
MDLVLGIVSIVLSVIVFVVSFNYDNYMYDVVGGGGFPKMLAVIIILCSLGMIGQYIADRKHKKPEKETKPEQKGNSRAAISLTAGVLVYILALETVGYLVCTVILVGFLLWVQKVRNPKVLLASTCTICGFLYVIFVLVLKVKLPTGFLI